MTQTQTYGENLVNKLLERLTKANPSEYFFIPEPDIIGRNRPVTPDFVIVSAKRGVYVVEVKDWVEFVPSGCDKKKVTIRRRDGVVDTHDNPILTARDYAHALNERLEQKKELVHKHGNTVKLKFPWQEVVILPNISKQMIQKFYDSGIWFPGTVLGKEDLTDVASLEAALSNVKMLFKIDGLDTTTLNIIRAVVNPALEVGNGGIETIQQEKIIREQLPLFGDNILTDEAKAVATDQHIRLVRGVAGSGKTLVLLRRAYYLRSMMPQLKILIMVFNRDLMDDTRRRVDDPDIEILNFHSMCSQIFKDVKKKWPQPTDARGWLEHDTESRTLLQQHNFDLDFVVSEIQWRKEARLYNTEEYLAADRRGRVKSLQRAKREAIDKIFQRYLQHQNRLKDANHDWEDWEDIPEITLEILQNPKHPKYQTYDVIMIDEGQDFAPAWLDIIRAMLKPNGSLFLCDDPTQSLFRSFTWAERGIEVRGRTRILRVPFRSTQRISLAAHALIQSNPLLKDNPELPTPDFKNGFTEEGETPLLVACRNLDQEVMWVKKYCQQQVEQGKSTAILLHDKRFVKHFASMRESGVYVESFGKMKGLEFDTVIIPFINSQFDGIDDDNAVDEQAVADELRRLFTAMTRAAKSLCMTYHNKMPRQLRTLVDEGYVYREYP